MNKWLWIYESHIFKLQIRREYDSDLHSNEHYLSSSEKRAWKKIKACTRFEPMTSAILVQCSTNWANKPTGNWSLCWFQTNLWSGEKTDKDVNNIVSFHYCISSVHYCEDGYRIHVFICSWNMWLSYIHSCLKVHHYAKSIILHSH